jgi:hypothetical protein
MRSIKGITFLLVGGLLCGAMVITSCGMSSQYNQANYPDSVLIQMFDKAGINPEVFTARITRCVRAEIVAGKFTRTEALDFIHEWQTKVGAGVGYTDIGALIDKYTKELLLPGGSDASEAAIIAYYMIVPDIALLNIPSMIGPQDKELALKFLGAIESSIK